MARKIRSIGEYHHKSIFQLELDSIEQAELCIPRNFVKRCSFSRTGWEYGLENMHIYVEEINNLPPSVEIVAPSQQEIFKFFEDIKIVRILNGSVFEWYCKSNFTK